MSLGAAAYRGGWSFELIEALVEICEQVLEPRHGFAAANDADVEIAGVADRCDVECVVVQRYGDRIVGEHPGAMCVQRYFGTGTLEITMLMTEGSGLTTELTHTTLHRAKHSRTLDLSTKSAKVTHSRHHDYEL